MKVARIYSYGNSDQIKIEESPQPQVHSEDILVKVHDAGVNPVDWKIREGFMKQTSPHFPITLGQDFAGEIVAVGDQVRDFKPGDNVFGFAPGSYAEYALVSPYKIALMPKSLNYEAAASIPTPGLTAWQLLEKAQLKAYQNILIHGAAGGVGSIACQIALWKKANVMGTASADDVSYLKKLGVQRTIDYKKDRFEEFAKDIDVVIDLVGGDTLARSYQVMKKGGIALSTVGAFKEADAAKFGVQGANFVMSPNAKDLSELAKLFDQKVIQVRVGEVLPLKEAKQAQDISQNGHAHGKVILKI
ncbi:NADP-dependent oxidoreductase [Bdellovibrio sp. HCB-162]|uniref:NADP-dependent oxidoreductase n=1 Tax=Bdellovibrio sp. HCB-162 TaxID=3394234 RepID=UPI0039BCDD31